MSRKPYRIPRNTHLCCDDLTWLEVYEEGDTMWFCSPKNGTDTLVITKIRNYDSDSCIDLKDFSSQLMAHGVIEYRMIHKGKTFWWNSSANTKGERGWANKGTHKSIRYMLRWSGTSAYRTICKWRKGRWLYSDWQYQLRNRNKPGWSVDYKNNMEQIPGTHRILHDHRLLLPKKIPHLAQS